MFPFAPGMLPWRVVYLIMSNVTLQFICSYNTFNCGMQFIKILHHKTFNTNQLMAVLASSSQPRNVY